MELEQHNAFMSAFVLGNLKEAFQQENVCVLLFVILFLMVLLVLNCTVFLACHTENHVPAECVDPMSIKPWDECFGCVWFGAATEAPHLS